MTRDTIVMAKREGIPFALKMADGREYIVTDRDNLTIGRTYVAVVDEKQDIHVLPMLTMTGISYLSA